MGTRNSILNTAKIEFIQKGYSGASMRKIAAKSGVTTGAIYGYFKDKDELFNEIVKSEMQSLKDEFKKFNENSLDRPEETIDRIKRFPYDRQIQKLMVEDSLNYYEFMYDFREIFMLLGANSNSEIYRNYIYEFMELDYLDSLKLIKINNKTDYIPDSTRYTLKLFIKSSIESIFEIFQDFKTFEEAKPYLEIYIRLYTTAFTQFLND